MRSTFKAIIITPVLALAMACGKDQAADPSLNNDLSLAAQANPAMRLDSISAAERANAGVAAQPAALRSTATAPAPARRTSAPARRTSTSRSSAGTSSGSQSTVAAEPRYEIKKNTKRDAAIGAAAGAIIGASTSRDKVKGGLIGAAAGGILGGVIGNNVDIEKKRVP